MIPIIENNHKSNRRFPHWEDGKLIGTHVFSKAATQKLKTGYYCGYPQGTPEYDDFWTEERKRCLEGYEINGVRITGYHYFFLNYYPMSIVDSTDLVAERISAFPNFWITHYYFFHLVDYCRSVGKHLCLIKPRGIGLSEIAASMGARDFAVTPVDKNGKLIHRKDFFYASQEGYLLKDGVIEKCWNAINFLNKETEGAFRHIRQGNSADSALHKKAQYLSKSGDAINKTGGEVIGKVIDKPDKVRGGRGYTTFYEESGAFPNLEKCIQISRPLVELGGTVFGIIICWGTSNEDDTGIEGFKRLFFNPSGYNMVKFRNVWDHYKDPDLTEIPSNFLNLIVEDDNDNDNVCGAFIPVYECMSRYMDEDGNTDRQKALDHHLHERKLQSSNEDGDIYIGDHPFKPAEALKKTGKGVFDSSKLSRQLSLIESNRANPDFFKAVRGNLFRTRKNPNAPFSKENPYTNIEFEEHPKGKFLILEHPEKDEHGNHYNDLYVAGADSIDQGLSDSLTNKGSNLGALVKKRIIPGREMSTTNNIYVASYLHRPYTIDEAYEDVLMLAEYYNAQVLIEYTKIGIKKYFESKKKLYMLMKRPQIAATSSSKKRTSEILNMFGIQMPVKIRNHGIELIKLYLKDFTENIFFDIVLRQLLDYTHEDKTKFDLVVAMMLCEIADQDLEGILASKPEEEPALQNDFGFYYENGKKKYGVIPKKSIEPKQFDKKMIDYIDGDTIYFAN